jgi:hypothetical protein
MTTYTAPAPPTPYAARLNVDYPAYVVGVGRWCLRVNAYAFLLVTDQYPPFSLK